jgi:hypothetical protein
MHRYRVIAADPNSGIVAVADDDGQCHLGRAVSTVPRLEAELLGPAPAVGVRELHLLPTETPCPLVLVLLGCDAEAARKVVGLPRQAPARAQRVASNE